MYTFWPLSFVDHVPRNILSKMHTYIKGATYSLVLMCSCITPANIYACLRTMHKWPIRLLSRIQKATLFEVSHSVLSFPYFGNLPFNEQQCILFYLGKIQTTILQDKQENKTPIESPFYLTDPTIIRSTVRTLPLLVPSNTPIPFTQTTKYK